VRIKKIAGELMERAMLLAERGRGSTSPNPFVGCIIVNEGKIVGEGFTQPCGFDHAEVRAIKSAGARCRGADMYVTLEPCCFQGRTPPCTEAIILAGLRKVYIGIEDPNPKVNGKGIELLKDAGLEVETGIKSSEIAIQLESYLLNIQKNRPFIIMKTAMTLDGYIAGSDGSSKWITGPSARKRVHQLRREVDAVLTGIGTVLADDPSLDNREGIDCSQPMRVILDNKLRLPLNSKIVQTAKIQRTLVFCGKNADEERENRLQKKGVEVIRASERSLDLDEILSRLWAEDIRIILIEAGEKVVSSFEIAGLIDKYLIFLAPYILGNGRRILSIAEHTNIGDKHHLQFKSWERYEEDLLITAYPKR
jgi:diaminohydroxyphosphoribosylaminopyrimidine deaminase / 5-amino-6-(5-phosphoribosylamino)uracil reductase